jgi:hypothetical protein
MGEVDAAAEKPKSGKAGTRAMYPNPYKAKA